MSRADKGDPEADRPCPLLQMLISAALGAATWTLILYLLGVIK